ncbi:MAG: hypothetical protein O7H39_08705 [Gammaproteobacteria bacterium]|nr:hypothetical protein [Gammaproteobacteria bacterium]
MGAPSVARAHAKKITTSSLPPRANPVVARLCKRSSLALAVNDVVSDVVNDGHAHNGSENHPVIDEALGRSMHIS